MKKTKLIIFFLFFILKLIGQTSDTIYSLPPEDDWKNVERFTIQLEKFINQNLKIHEFLKNDTVNRQIKILIHVTDKGEVSKVEIVRGLSFDLDREVLRIVNLMHFEKAFVYSSDGRPYSITLPLTINIRCDKKTLHKSEDKLKSIKNEK